MTLLRLQPPGLVVSPKQRAMSRIRTFAVDRCQFRAMQSSLQLQYDDAHQFRIDNDR